MEVGHKLIGALVQNGNYLLAAQPQLVPENKSAFLLRRQRVDTALDALRAQNHSGFPVHGGRAVNCGVCLAARRRRRIAILFMPLRHGIDDKCAKPFPGIKVELLVVQLSESRQCIAKSRNGQLSGHIGVKGGHESNAIKSLLMLPDKLPYGFFVALFHLKQCALR